MDKTVEKAEIIDGISNAADESDTEKVRGYNITKTSEGTQNELIDITISFTDHLH